MRPLASLIATGTKLWVDSVDPDLVASNAKDGATGATSNPIIISDLIKSGRFDQAMQQYVKEGLSDADIAWRLTDDLVCAAEKVFKPVFDSTRGNDGYVSFELDPLLESDPRPVAARAKDYIKLGKQWSKDHPNRMIKVPATEAGIAALPELAAAGVPLNVTLIFTMRQYTAARDAVVSGMKKDGEAKSVYSIFVSRLDTYTESHVTKLTAGQGWVGIVNAVNIWQANEKFWQSRSTKLRHEIVFASTGTKKPSDPAWKYVEALAGSDIQTNPPSTNDAYQKSNRTAAKALQNPQILEAVYADIARHVDFQHLEASLMDEGLAKFIKPQEQLLQLISDKRRTFG